MLKKLIIAMFTTCLAFTLTACTKEAPEQNTKTKDEETMKEVDKEESKTASKDALIVYFSWSGNTEAVAKEIQSQTGTDIFEINPVNSYPDNYDDLLEIAEKEKSENAAVNIEEEIANFEDYQIIYLGYPIWWADMPMIVNTFLEDYDLSEKTVIPFCTSGGSGFSASLDRIQRMEPEATMLDGLSVLESDSENLKDLVQSWLAKLDMIDE